MINKTANAELDNDDVIPINVRTLKNEFYLTRTNESLGAAG